MRFTELLPVDAGRHFAADLGDESLHVIVSHDQIGERLKLWHFSVSVKRPPAGYARWPTYAECAQAGNFLVGEHIIPPSCGLFDRMDSEEVPVRHYWEIPKR